MKKLLNNYPVVFVMLVILCCVLLLTKCISPSARNPVLEKNDRFNQFAGGASCAGCHKEIYESHIRTGHFLTSQSANDTSIAGSFKPGKNTYQYNPLLHIAMEKRDSGLFQVVYYKGVEKKYCLLKLYLVQVARGNRLATGCKTGFFNCPLPILLLQTNGPIARGFRIKCSLTGPLLPAVLNAMLPMLIKFLHPMTGMKNLIRPK